MNWCLFVTVDLLISRIVSDSWNGWLKIEIFHENSFQSLNDFIST